MLTSEQRNHFRALLERERVEIQSRLTEMRVIAPSDAVLEVLSVKVGDVLPADREVATLLLTQHLWVRVYVPETWLGNISPPETSTWIPRCRSGWAMPPAAARSSMQ